jgi:hypothetical protein
MAAVPLSELPRIPLIVQRALPELAAVPLILRIVLAAQGNMLLDTME